MAKNATKSNAAIARQAAKFMEFKLGKKLVRETRLPEDTLMSVFNASAAVITSERKVAVVVREIGKKGFHQTKREYVAGRVAVTLYRDEELTATHRDRALAAMARKGWSEKDPSNNSRRTKLEHEAVRSAERHWTRFLEDNKIENQETRGGHNKGKTGTTANGKKGTGKAKGETTPESTLLPPDAAPVTPRVSTVEDVEKLTKEMANRLVTLQKVNALPMPSVLAAAYVAAAKLLTDALDAFHASETTKCDLTPNLAPLPPALPSAPLGEFVAVEKSTVKRPRSLPTKRKNAK